MQAEAEASTLSRWSDVYASFQKYKACDDGAIAEGYSEAISLLLAKHWDQLGELLTLMKKSSDFQLFIIHHVDETVPNDRLSEIAANAKACPLDAPEFCSNLQKAVAQ